MAKDLRSLQQENEERMRKLRVTEEHEKNSMGLLEA